MEMDLQEKATLLAERVKHYLVIQTDRLLEEASDYEIFQALLSTLREEIVVNWSATHRTFVSKRVRKLYYLSMEYLPGPCLIEALTNTHAHPLIAAVLQRLNRNISNILACEPEPGLGNGGLGRLASCFLESLATQEYPAMGYGLRYQYGIFEQQLWDGVQIERPDPWLLYGNPWHTRRNFRAATVKYCGFLTPTTNRYGDEIYALHDYEEVRALPYDLPIIGYTANHSIPILTLRLWTTKESPRNFQLQRYNAGQLDQAAENTTLTDVLYPSDHHPTGKRIRLKQEFLLVSASAQDILRQQRDDQGSLAEFADKVRIQINDTHPALVCLELIRLLAMEEDFSWEEAWEIVQSCCSFTNHTVLKEALEEWNIHRFQYLLPVHYKILTQLNERLCREAAHHFSHAPEKVEEVALIGNGQVRMANLAIYSSHHINGVAALHSEILKRETFKTFYELYPKRFVNVTNGVTPRRWLLTSNPALSQWITERIGDGWIRNFMEIRKIREFASDPDSQAQFLEIKKANKERLIEALCEKHIDRNRKGEGRTEQLLLTPTSLFESQIKRIHEYKRQLMHILYGIILYQQIKENPSLPLINRTLFFAGKAAAGYRIAKQIIRLIYLVGRTVNHDPDIKEKLRICFIENYNVSWAQLIIPATDLSIQISTAGTEASGTGNMKFAMNGALTIGTEDGACVEMRQEITDRWWPFRFGASVEEISALRHSQRYSAHDHYIQNPLIHRALDALRDGTFALTEEEHECCREIYHSLLEGAYGAPADYYFVLYDLPSYLETQQKVAELYSKPQEWASYAIHNLAGMGRFSVDRSIHEYASKIWEITPCPQEKGLIDKIREEYAEHLPTLIV